MFTGIIEEIGRVENIKKGPKSLAITIRGKKIFDDLKIGDSVAVNGVCLTATTIGNDVFTADVMPESIKMTTFTNLKVHQPVNLERAMPASGRFGGHIVAGHVDGTGRIINREQTDNAVIFTIDAPTSVMDYVIYKGSITINGISLTIMRRTDSSFSVSIIPHTLSETVLGTAHIGTEVNLETDIAGRYIRHFMNVGVESTENKEEKSMHSLLVENGFI
ncbi:riboflavin synthase [Veillonella denticariosi]|uniref:riboflavin synthase n=1 Tax=Veillonella denticariosi TaxID=419208 RepID=UPI00248FE4BA|nr:riboflavin synthase [Veillonella denticariosi]